MNKSSAFVGLALIGVLVSSQPAASVPSLSPKVYQQLSQAQELMQKGQKRQALRPLQMLSADPALSPYESAVVQQTLGYVHAALDQNQQAVAAFQASLAGNVLPAEDAQAVRYNLAQLHIGGGRYTQGAQLLEAWLAEAPNPKPEVYALLAQVYGHLKRYAEVEQHLQKAIAQSDTFHEEWYQLLLFAHIEQQAFGPAVSTLKQLLNRFPTKKTYWLQLSEVYRQAKQPRQAAAALGLAHRLGLLDEPEVLYVVESYLHLGLPYKAAHVLTEGFEAQTVAKTAQHQELLVTCWLHAKEYQQALDTLGTLAQHAQTGQADIRRAEIFAQRERWQEAVAALRAGLIKGGLKDVGQVYVLLGIAHYRTGALADSRAAFRKAASHRSVAQHARQWIQLLNQEQAQEPDR